MRHLAVSAVGRDRPGIVAAVSGVLLAHSINIEDSQMTILGGHFSMVLIVAASDDLDAKSLRSDLERAGERVGLETISLSEVEELAAAQPEPSHVVTVYGVDHPGIVHAVSAAMGERNVNITDLNTRLVGDHEEERLYAMMLEVELPPELPPDELRKLLEGVGREQGVEVTLRPLEQDVL
jgi:glycine cleavage system transcriptional repressor